MVFWNRKGEFIKRFLDDQARYQKAKTSLDVEFLTIQYFQVIFGQIEYPSVELEKRDVDFIYQGWKFSIKTDWRAWKTGNLAVERKFLNGEADYFIFSIVKGFQKKEYAIIYDLIPLVISKPELARVIDQLPQKRITKEIQALNSKHKFRNYQSPHSIHLLPIHYAKPLISFILSSALKL